MMNRRTFFSVAAAVVTGVLGFQIGSRGPSGEPASPGPVTAPVSRDAPLIGIASLVSDDYIRAVREGGGIPVVLPNTDGSLQNIDSYLESLDGLLMPGGLDIPPSEYGEEPHETVKVLDDSRYQFEKALCTAWIKRSRKPMLGICLGSQWINVASGGSLVQDIPSEFNVVHRNVNHQVTLEPDSRLGRIFGETDFEVNSFHHQAVRRLGEGLRIVAKSPEGIVEGFETTDADRFLVGVQWHPEKLMPKDARQTKLLKAFVAAAAENRRQRAAKANE